MLRFANGLFDAMWNRRARRVGADRRAGEARTSTDRAVFYDATGAMLDMLVTHLFQVAAEVAMEPPASLGAADLQAAREEVIGCFRPLDPAEVVLGQFDGYRDVQGVAAGSTHGHVRRGPAVDRQRPRGAACRSCCAPASGWPATTQRVSLILREPAGPLAGQLPADGERAVVLAGRRRRDRPVDGGQEARARARPDRHATRRSRWPTSPAPTRCRRTSG